MGQLLLQLLSCFMFLHWGSYSTGSFISSDSNDVINGIQYQDERYLLSKNKEEKKSFWSNLFTIFSSSAPMAESIKKEDVKLEPVRIGPNPFTMINQSYQAAQRVKDSTIKNLGMWKIESENLETFKLHNQFSSNDNIFKGDLTGSWRKQTDKSLIKVEHVENSEVGGKHIPSKPITPGSFLFHIQNLPSLSQNPHMAIVWDGSESELHSQPWKFGHALGRTGGRRSCGRWYFEVESGLGCHAGMECFWRDMIHPKLKHRTVISPEPTWERGACGDRYKNHKFEEDSLCFLTPAAHHRRHAIAIPWMSPFSPQTEEELQNHIQMVAWEGRRDYLVSHVFPIRDIPTFKQRNAYYAHLKSLKDEKNRLRRKVHPSTSQKTKAEIEADAFAAKTFSAFGIRSVEVIETRLRRALRGVCMEDKRCLSMDSEYELAVHTDGGKRNGELSLFEKSIKPVKRRQVASSFLSSDFCLMPPLTDGLGPSRPALIDALLAGCIPVFFATCLDDRLAYETLYAPHFLPGHSRGNRTKYESKFAVANNADAGHIDGDIVNKNDGFGVGTWAVLIDARPLRLNEDGNLLEYFTSNTGSNRQKAEAEEIEENREEFDSKDIFMNKFEASDGSLDDPKENIRRIRAARQVISYLASIPSSEKRRMRKVIIDAIPKLQYPFRSTVQNQVEEALQVEGKASPFSIAQFPKKTKPSGKESIASDPPKTSVEVIVADILDQRFQFSSCSDVNCPSTKFSLVDEIAFGSSHISGGDDDLAGAAAEFRGMNDDVQDKPSSLSYTTQKEGLTGDGWGGSGGILMGSLTRRLDTGKTVDTFSDKNISSNKEERRRTAYTPLEFLKSSAPKVCASKSAPPLQSTCTISDGSWFAARDHCESVGARLCTSSELRNGLGWNTGCHSGDKLMWSSTPCGDWTKSVDEKGAIKGGGMYLLVNQAKRREKSRAPAKAVPSTFTDSHERWGDLWRRHLMNTSFTSFNNNSGVRRLDACKWSQHLHRMVCPDRDTSVELGGSNTIQTAPLAWSDPSPKKELKQTSVQSNQRSENWQPISQKHHAATATKPNSYVQSNDHSDKTSRTDPLLDVDDLTESDMEKLTAYSHAKRDDFEQMNRVTSICLSAFDFGFYELKPPSPICCADFHNEFGECSVATRIEASSARVEINGMNDHAKKRAAKRYANRIGGEIDVLGGFIPSSISETPVIRTIHGQEESVEVGSVRKSSDESLVNIMKSHTDKFHKKKPKMAVLLFGPFGKTYNETSQEFGCSEKGLEEQLEAANSQRKGLLVPLHLKPRIGISSRVRGAASSGNHEEHPGFDVDVYIASTLSCGAEFDLKLKEAYSPYLKAVIYDPCIFSDDKRCLLDKGLDMVESSFETYAFLVIGRQDTSFSSLRAPSLIADMVKDVDTLSFAFKCSNQQWTQWQCVADTIIAVPGHRLQSFRKYCVGYRSGNAQCFHRSNQKTQNHRRLLGHSFNETKSRRLFTERRRPPLANHPEKVKALHRSRVPSTHASNVVVEFEESTESAAEMAKKGMMMRKEVAQSSKRGGDGGLVPHDGSGCYQCAKKMAQQHVNIDTVYQSSDFPGNDYQCFEVENIKSSEASMEAYELCAKSCSDERAPAFGRCVGWSMKIRSRPPHSCCLKKALSELLPSSRVVSGVMATPGGLAGMHVEIVRNEFREESEWRSYSRGVEHSNPYFTQRNT